jgi:hypothetical protein
MPFSSDNLLKQLDRPEIINWALELKNREEAFAFLMLAVRGDQLNRDQHLNALHMLFRMAFPENGDEVLRTLVNLSAHSDLAVRSEAVQLAIGLVRVSANLRTPLAFSEAQEQAVRQSMVRGLTTKVRELAEAFFKEK